MNDQTLDASGFRDMVVEYAKTTRFIAFTSRCMTLPQGSSQESWDQLIAVRETLDAAHAEMQRAIREANVLTEELRIDQGVGS